MAASPVHFYLPARNWPPADILAGNESNPSLYFNNTGWAWVLRTYLQLRRRGRAVELTSTLPESGITLLCSGDVPATFKPGPQQFLVSANADEAPDVFAQMHVTQNRIQARLVSNSHYIPHWPQPGLIKRDPARGMTFSTIAYYGDDRNLAPELRDPRWRKFLASRNIAWEIRNAASARNTDFSDVDATIAVRSFQHSGFIRKPASKLFNAWIAEVPAMLGRELAYREQRRGAPDYIEIASFDAACAAVDRLASSPNLRQEMIDNGRRRAAEISPERITDLWESLLFELAPQAADRWGQRSDRGRKTFFLRCQAEKKLRGVAHRLLRAAGQEQYAI